LARVIGPAIAGALIAVLGLSWCFIINAISYIASLAGFFMMRGSELHISPLVEKAKGQLKEGLRYVVSQPNLKITLIIMVIVGTLSYEFSVALPLLAKFTFNGDAATYAELSASMGIGAVMGGLYSASRHKMSVRLIIIGAFLFGASLLIVSAAPNLLSAMISLVLVGALSVNMSSMASSTLQLESAPEMRGRVMALWTVAILGSTPIGGPIIGYVGQYAGPRWGLVLGGVAAVFAAGIGTLYTRKQKPA